MKECITQDVLDEAGPGHGRPDNEQPEDTVIGAAVGGREEGAVEVGQVEDEDAKVVGRLRHPVLVERGGRQGVEGRVHPEEVQVVTQGAQRT